MFPQIGFFWHTQDLSLTWVLYIESKAWALLQNVKSVHLIRELLIVFHHSNSAATCTVWLFLLLRLPCTVYPGVWMYRSLYVVYFFNQSLSCIHFEVSFLSWLWQWMVFTICRKRISALLLVRNCRWVRRWQTVEWRIHVRAMPSLFVSLPGRRTRKVLASASTEECQSDCDFRSFEIDLSWTATVVIQLFTLR